MTILTRTFWFLGNFAWNALIGFCFALAVYAVMDAHVAGEAASIGLLTVDDTPLWVAAAIGNALAWGVSWTIGWAAVFEFVPFLFVAAWLVD